MAEKEQIVVGKKAGFGTGLFVIGLIQLLLPTMSQRVADLEFVQSEAFGVMSGAVLVLAVIIMVAGVVLVFTKFDDVEGVDEQ
jgi:hypothetical protein